MSRDTDGLCSGKVFTDGCIADTLEIKAGLSLQEARHICVLTSIISPAQKSGVSKGQASSAMAGTHGVHSPQELGGGPKGPDEKATVKLSSCTVVSSDIHEATAS